MFTLQQKAFLLESYFRNGRLVNGEWQYSNQACMQEFRLQFPNIAFNNNQIAKQLKRSLANFRETASADKKRRGGRPRVRTANVINTVRNAIEERPTSSIRRLSQEINLKKSTLHNVLKQDIGMHPYKVQMFQELLPPDYDKRIQYCQWFTENLNNNDVLNKTFFSDEAWFHLNGYINAQNMRMWGTENPHYFREATMHPVKIGVWLAVSRRRIVGPIFFEETLNAENYRNIMLEPFLNQLHDDELQTGYFQQDSARPHIARVNLNYLQEFFDERLISQDRFPPRSCDLTPLDYFVFPYLKNNIFRTPVHTIDDLKDNIQRQCNQINAGMLVNVFESMKRRINLCIQQNGQHFQHLL